MHESVFVIQRFAKRKTKSLYVNVISSSMIPNEKIFHSRFATFRMTAKQASIYRQVKKSYWILTSTDTLI